LPSNTNLFSGLPVYSAVIYKSNGVAYAVGSQDATGGVPRFPAFQLVATDTNGNAAWRFYDYFDVSVPADGTNWNWANTRPRLDVMVGPNGGLNYRGRLIEERRSATIAAGACALDFAASQCTDLTAATNAITFSTTNATGALTNIERRTFIIRSGGFSPALTWPAAWCVLGNPGAASTGSMPASMSAGQLIRLELESVGPGESNIIACAQLATDNAFAWDSNVQDYVTAAGIGSLAVKSALQAFVTKLKSDGTWNQFTNGAIYPFAAGNAAGNALNLVNTNTYKITWAGSLTHSAAGVKGDGSSGYGDTHWTNAVLSSVSLFTFCKTNFPVTFTYPIGAYDGTHFMAFRHGGLTDRCEGGMDDNSVTDVAVIPATFVGTALMFTRTNSTTEQAYCDYSQSASAGVSSTALPNLSAYLFALNNQGSPGSFWGDVLQITAVGAGCSQAQYQTLYSASTNLNTTLGR
jgi:hypothetical protein